jgi:hypothetical protein
LTVHRKRPRFVITQKRASGETAYYFNVPKYHLDNGCPNLNQPLGRDYIVACGENGEGGRAAALNARFDEWFAKLSGLPVEEPVRIGTVDWLFREYKKSAAYLRKVSARSRGDYERTMKLVTEIVTKQGDRLGERMVRAISPEGADRAYLRIIGVDPDRPIEEQTPKRLRQGEKAVMLCSKAWRVVRRLYPAEFRKADDNPDPWNGVAILKRIKNKKAAATRDDVYKFAWGCIELQQPEVGAAAVICFEWLQRPENVIGGFIRWADYRNNEHPNQIRIEHHKTGQMVLHPLEEWQKAEGAERPQRVLFYEEAEQVLSHVAKNGIAMIVNPQRRRTKNRERVVLKPYTFTGMQHAVQRLRKEIGLSASFTLDACRHGGMTELEEAGLTDGQGRALSAHTSKAYDGYAKRTEMRALAATRKRFAHVMTDKSGTEFQSAGSGEFQSAETEKTKSA